MVYVKGWFECYDDGLIYTSDESWNKGNPYDKDVIRLSNILEEFSGKKIKIIIEEMK